MDIQRYDSNEKLSKVVVHGDTVYISGQVPSDATASVENQTQQVLNKIDEYLATAGSDKSQVLFATVYVKDLANLAAINSVWSSWLVKGKAPARACIEGTAASSDSALEIAVIAAA